MNDQENLPVDETLPEAEAADANSENQGEAQSDTGTDAPSPAPRNVAFTRDQFEKEIAKFGRDAAHGANSRPAMALRAMEATQQLVNVGPDDAQDLYRIFQKSVARVKGIEYKVDASEKQQVSKLRQFMQMAAHPNIDGVEVMYRAIDKIKELAAMEKSPLKGSTYDNMTNVARAQNRNPDEALTDDEIEAVLTPDDKGKTPLEKLVGVYKTLHKLFESETLPRESLAGVGDAIHSLSDAIKEAGGELPVDTKKKNAEEATTELKLRADVIRAKRAGLAQAIGAKV